MVSWHRRGFRLFWTWISRRKRSGRPGTSRELRDLVWKMAEANPLWGAPRIHGELLKLGLKVSERTVSRLMPKRRKPPSQSWRAFLANHVNELISIDFSTVPTATFRVLFVLVVLAHHRRRVPHFNVTEHPDGLVDRAADNRNLSGRYSTPLPAARPGQNLQRGGSAANSKPGYGGGPLRACQPLAAGVCGEADRIHSARLLRQRDHSWSKASPGPPEKLPGLLSPEPDSLSAR